MSTNRIQIIPAVMPQSLQDLQEHLAPLRGVVRQVQADIVDGQYAKTKTWPYRDRGSFEEIAKQNHGLPFWDELDYQFDLMLERPEEEVIKFVDAGASEIILHATSPGALKALSILVDRRDQDVGVTSTRIGVALGAHAQPEDLLPFESQFDFVQVMGIEREGRQGEPFDPDKKALHLLERLRRLFPELRLQVDGGVSMENARELVAAGASRLVVGHAIVKAADPAAAYREFVALVNE